MIGELPMGVALIEKAERVVEALAIRLAGRARLASPPLADQWRCGSPPRAAPRRSSRPRRAAAIAFGSAPLPRIHAWPVCIPVISAARDGAQTVLPE